MNMEDFFLIYLIGMTANFVVLMSLWMHNGLSEDDDEAYYFVLLTTALWPLMDVLILGFFVGGYMILLLDFLRDKVIDLCNWAKFKLKNRKNV